MIKKLKNWFLLVFSAFSHFVDYISVVSPYSSTVKSLLFIRLFNKEQRKENGAKSKKKKSPGFLAFGKEKLVTPFREPSILYESSIRFLGEIKNRLSGRPSRLLSELRQTTTKAVYVCLSLPPNANFAKDTKTIQTNPEETIRFQKVIETAARKLILIVN